jgi:hypothetical protein
MESIIETPALEDMKEYDHWLMWKMVDGRKVPVSFADCKSGSVSMYEKTWCSYEKAKEALESGKFTGIGFVFNEDNPYVGVDLDKCRDKVTGVIDEWAQKIITEINSYTELSPSGTGVHIISNGDHVPVGHNPRGAERVEMYSWGRYFTFTGQHLAGTPDTIEDRHDVLREMEKRIFKKSNVIPKSTWEGIDFQVSRSARAPVEKLKLLLSRNAMFRKTWKQTRTDLKDQSNSDLDATICLAMVEDDWEPWEVAAGLIEYRSQWCKGDALEKIFRADYIGRTWAWATECHQQGVDIDEYHIKEAVGDSAFHQMSSRLGAMVTRVTKMGGEPSVYFMQVEGKSVRIGDMLTLKSWMKTSAAILDATGKHINQINGKKWHQVVGLIRQCAEYREVPGAGRVAELDEVVEGYMERRNPDVQDIKGAFIEKLPFKQDGYLYLNKSDLKKYIDHRTNLRYGLGELGNLLAEAGWESHKKTMHTDDGNVCRQFWRIKRDV